MYGLVNKAVQDLVVSRFGEERWDEILEEAEVDEVGFIAMDQYDDALTYALVSAASKVLGVEASVILEAFGEYWITYTVDEGYGAMMSSFGSSLDEFLHSLNDLHARISETMTGLRPPRFVVKSGEDSTLVVDYYSDRAGLAPMVVGLLRGLAKRFDEAVDVESAEPRAGAQATFRVRRKARNAA